MTFDLHDGLGSPILFQKWILEVRIIWTSGITLLSKHISSKVKFSSLSDMLIICWLAIMQIKKFPKVAVVATKLNFLQYTYGFRINNKTYKTLYSQTCPGPHFGSWTIVDYLLASNYLTETMVRYWTFRNKLQMDLSPLCLCWPGKGCRWR